jgi:hypothetical protein
VSASIGCRTRRCLSASVCSAKIGWLQITSTWCRARNSALPPGLRSAQPPNQYGDRSHTGFSSGLLRSQRNSNSAPGASGDIDRGDRGPAMPPHKAPLSRVAISAMRPSVHVTVLAGLITACRHDLEHARCAARPRGKRIGENLLEWLPTAHFSRAVRISHAQRRPSANAEPRSASVICSELEPFQGGRIGVVHTGTAPRTYRCDQDFSALAGDAPRQTPYRPRISSTNPERFSTSAKCASRPDDNSRPSVLSIVWFA